MKPWTHNGKPFLTAPEDHYGFIYVITDVDTGKKYIGKKAFWYRLARPPLKGQKRRRIMRKESNWKQYWGSCDELLAQIKFLGHEAFSREIVLLCKTRGEHTYAEVEAQVKNDVLTAKLANGQFAYYNSNILSRFFR